MNFSTPGRLERSKSDFTCIRGLLSRYVENDCFIIFFFTKDSLLPVSISYTTGDSDIWKNFDQRRGRVLRILWSVIENVQNGNKVPIGNDRFVIVRIRKFAESYKIFLSEVQRPRIVVNPRFRGGNLSLDSRSVLCGEYRFCIVTILLILLLRAL